MFSRIDPSPFFNSNKTDASLEIQRPKVRIAVIAALLCLFASTASANRDSFSIQAGSGSPLFGGKGRGGAAIQYAHRFGDRNYLGAEIEYRNQETEIWDVDNVDVDTINIRLFYRVDMTVDTVITPYFTVGLGGIVNRVADPGAVEARLAASEPDSTFEINRTGGGFGLLGAVGLEYAPPGADWISLFAEGRVDIGLVTHEVEEVDSDPGIFEEAYRKDSYLDGQGGASGYVGIRLHF